MSSSSPRDLAIAFRSLARRLREAFGDDPPPSTGTAELERIVGDAATLLGTRADAGAVADAIEAVPADAWDDAVLERLRALGLDLGAELRRVAAAHPRDDD